MMYKYFCGGWVFVFFKSLKYYIVLMFICCEFDKIEMENNYNLIF